MLIVKSIQSKDEKATKNIFITKDHYLVESTYVDYKNKHIICYSTQVGCNNGCKMCINGIKPHFVRNLTSGEICTECLFTGTKAFNCHPGQEKPILFSAMGAGDPLDNFQEYVKSVEWLHEEFPNAKFALSTVAAVPSKIMALTRRIPKDVNMKLQISLHSAFKGQRKLLMPNAGDLEETMNMGLHWALAKSNVEFNVVLIKGVNDNVDHAREIVKLIDSHFGIYKNLVNIKINKFNENDECLFQGSDKPTINKFISEIKASGLNVEYYETNGSDIGAACGQLKSEYEKGEI